jgi:hypothetical protein
VSGHKPIVHAEPVIARFDRAIQYAVWAIVREKAGDMDYWMPRFRGA